MLKFATAQIIAASLGDEQQRFSRAAHRAVFQYEARPGFLYVRSRAISSRCNDNFDEFPADEIAAAYRTFVGKPVFVNHVNSNHRRARGVIIDAALHQDKNPDGTPDTWAEVLMEIDAKRFPKLAKAILKGDVDRTSMGCDVERSVCSACGNEARTPAEYCAHIPHLKGKRIFRASATGKKVGELVRETCYGLAFFENSVLVEPPADPTAHFLGVDSSGLGKAASKEAGIDYSSFDNDDLEEEDDDGEHVTPAPKPAQQQPTPHVPSDGTPADPKRRQDAVIQTRPFTPLKPSLNTLQTTASKHTSVALQNTDTLNEANKGAHPEDWFHGTSHQFTHFGDSAPYPPEHHDPYEDTDHHGADEGSSLSGTGHWNTRLGTHFAADHGVAEQFAEGDNARVVHARLHMQNPKRYFSEYDMDHEVHTDEHERGNHITPHLDHADGAVDWDRNEAEAELHRGDDARGPYSKDHWQFGRNRPMASSWVNSHPDREGMADRFKQKLMDQGHDGILYRNEIEKGKGSRWTAVAFHPHQIEISHVHPVGAPHASPEEAEVFRRHYPGHGQTELPIHASLIDATFIDPDGGIRMEAYGEIKAPADVDTLREENCPVCGDKDTFDGIECQICGFINPPEQFRDPDLDKAKTMDLRKQIVDPQLIDNNGELQRVDDNGDGMPQDGEPGEPGQEGLQDQEQDPNDPQAVDPDQLDENGLPPSPYGDQALDGTQQEGPAVSDRNGDGVIQMDEIDPDGNVNAQQDQADPGQGGQAAPRELPYWGQDHTGDSFTQGPDMPYRPDDPTNPNEKLDQDDAPYGRAPAPMVGQPGDGVPDLFCPSCGFGADASQPQSQDMGNPQADGVLDGDVCPSCQRAQLLTPGEINSNYSKTPAVEKPSWS